MSINITGTPRAILNGVQDRSSSALPTQLAAINGFNPILYLLTQRGPEGTHDLAAVGGVNTYGTESFRAGSAYYNHQTVLANEVIPFAPAHIHRVRLPGAARSIMRVSAELATCTVPVYLYDTLGNVKTEVDSTGARVPIIDGYTVGSRIILHYGVDMYPAEQRGVGKGTIIENFRPGNTLAQVDLPNLPTAYLSYTLDFDPPAPAPKVVTPLSGMTTNDIMSMLGTPAPVVDPSRITFHSTTLIPLFETEVAYFGGVGDRLGIVIDDLITEGVTSSVMWDINNFVYQIRLIERMSGDSTKIINTVDGDRVTAFTLGSSAYSDRTHTDYNVKSVIARKYNDNLSNGYVYDSNINNLQKMLVEGYTLTDGTLVDGELSHGNDGLLSLGVINILGGHNANGKLYKTLRLQDSYSFGGSTLGGSNPVYGQQGSDGLVYDENGRPDHLTNLRLFDEEVRRQLDNFGDLDDPLLDIARYPISSLVDTGYSQETKDAMISAYNKRPDLFAILATFRVADYTEPEIPPKPDPRVSVTSILRPNADAFTAHPNAIKAQYLTYTIVKSPDGLTTDVNIVVDSNIPNAELVDQAGNYRPVILASAIANSEWLYLELNQPTDPDAHQIADIKTVDVMTGIINPETQSLSQIRADYTFISGNQHVAIDSYPLNKLGTVESNGLVKLGQYRIERKINFDGLVDPEHDTYKETESIVNLTVTHTKRFAGNEGVMVFQSSITEPTYSGKVGTVEFSDLNQAALVALLATHNVEAIFVPLGKLGV